MMDVAIEDQSGPAANPPAPADQAAKPRLPKRRRSDPSKSAHAAAAPAEQQQSDAVTQPTGPPVDLQLFGELRDDEDNTAWLVRSTRSATTGKLSLQVLGLGLALQMLGLGLGLQVLGNQ